MREERCREKERRRVGRGDGVERLHLIPILQLYLIPFI